MSSQVVLILGAGSHIGALTAHAFAAKGWRVALVSRSRVNGYSAEGYLEVCGDLSRPSTIAFIFEQVRKALGIPNAVIYNGKIL